MSTTSMRKFVAFITSLLLVSCVTPTPTTNEVGQAYPPQWPRSTQLESSWGAARGPSMLVTGQQAITYVKPSGGTVEIAYEGKNKPRDIVSADGIYASDGTLTVMGQQVAFYGSGNEDPAISTQAMQLTDPMGRTGWFTFNFSAPEHLKGKNIPTFGW